MKEKLEQLKKDLSEIQNRIDKIEQEERYARVSSVSQLKMNGFYWHVNEDNKIVKTICSDITTMPEDKNRFSSLKLAKAHQILPELIMLRDNWRDGSCVYTWSIVNTVDGLEVREARFVIKTLSFQDQQTANDFLNQFRNKLEIYKPLL